jgi:hypothetical protein
MALKGTEDLTSEEVSALASAATWYANYHARIIAEKADDPSAQARAELERYETLLSGLRKLGIRLPSVELLHADLNDRVEAERQVA